MILGALLPQHFITRSDRLAGAIVGFLITTGVLIWGNGAYAQSGGIAILGIALSQPIFIMACIAWYIFDARLLLAAIAEKHAIAAAAATLLPDTAQALAAPATQAAEPAAVSKLRGECPSCGTLLELDAQECGHCRADLTWRCVARAAHGLSGAAVQAPGPRSSPHAPPSQGQALPDTHGVHAAPARQLRRPTAN